MSVKKSLLNSLKERYWDKVDLFDCNNGCWIWKGSCAKGYGEIWVGKALPQSTLNKVRATRLALYFYDGVWDESKHILHKCDTPSCVNPLHLSRGTHQENMKDREAKKRNKPRIKFSPDVILAIENAHKCVSNSELSCLFDMTSAHVSRVRRKIGKRTDIQRV